MISRGQGSSIVRVTVAATLILGASAWTPAPMAWAQDAPATDSSGDLPTGVIEPLPPEEVIPSAATEESDLPQDDLPTMTVESPPPAAEEAAPADVAQEEPLPEAPSRTGQELDEDKLLASPTLSYEDYERVRRKRFHKSTIPSWSANLTVEPFAFEQADLRIPFTSTAEDPGLVGVTFGLERMIIRQLVGLLSVGLEAGAYTTGARNNPSYEKLLTGFWSVQPYAQYQAHFFQRQWVVPTVKAGYEVVRYGYRFEGNRITGLKQLPRIDLGLLLFLNPLEPSAAGSMSLNYGIKRTYLSAYYSMATDSDKKDFDLSEGTYRVGLRFEY